MSRDLADLVPAFQPLASQLITNCSACGVEMRPCFTLRTPQEQAVLWRSSRTKEQIDTALVQMQAAGAHWLASVLESVGPQAAKQESTRALPGLSWHQWGEAIDCFVVENGTAVWSGGGYYVYSNEAHKLGLTTLSFERVHAQMRKQGSPLDLWSWAEIDAKMKDKFSSG